MAGEIVIRVKLDDREIIRSAQQIARATSNALDTGVSASRQHAQRLEQIARLSAAQIEVIERRKQAQLETIRARAADRAVEHERKIQRESQRSSNALDLTRATVGKLSGAFAALAGVGAVALFRSIGDSAVQAAIDIDRQVSVLRALTGSAQAAEQRFAQLIALAEKTPGLTTELAAALDVQLRILDVSEKTINRLLPAIGRLNAISPISDPNRFVGNLVQLVTQNFERQDLKELVGQSPIAGELIKGIFDVNSPTNAKAIREAAQRLGIRSVEDLAIAFAEEAEKNSKLQGAVESLGTQFQKAQDKIKLALAPVGAELSKILLPLLGDIAEASERYGKVAAEVFRENRSDILSTVRSVGDLVTRIGDLIGVIFTLGGQKSALSGLRQEFEDLASIFAFLTDLSEGNIIRRPRTQALSREQEAGRSSPFLESPVRKLDLKPPPTPTPGRDAASEASRQAVRELKAIREAERELAKTHAEGIVQLAKAEREEILAVLKDQHERGLISTREFFDEKFAIHQRNIGNERALLQIEITQLEEARNAAKGAEKIKIETKLADLYTQQQLKVLELTKAQRENFEEFLKAAALPDLIEAETVKVIDLQAEARERRAAELRRQASQSGIAEIELRRQELQIQNALASGAITEGEARQAMLAVERQTRDVLLQALEAQEKLTADPEKLAQIQLQVEQVKLMGIEFSNAQRFARGFNSQIDTVGSAFERLGQNVSRALTSTKDLLNSLKQAVLGFFNDLLGRSLQNLMRSVLSPILGGLGGLNPAAAGAGGIGSIFRTPSTFPANLSASAFQSIAAAVGGGGGGLTAPPSITALSQFFGPSVPRTAGVVRGGIDEFVGGGVPRTAGKINFSLGAFGKSIGKSIGAIAPFLGFSLGAGAGGQSTAGQILGGIGGALGGLVLGAATGGITGGLGSAFALSGALGPAALIAAPLLIVGGILLGKAKQRRQDEESSGQMLTQALQGIEQLATGIANDQIEGSQARGIFDAQILGTFRQQILTLKTESVRKSRLTNQVRDLENVYQARIPSLIEAQQQRRASEQRLAADQSRFDAIDRRLIPQFAIGGMSSGGLAVLHPNEMVLTPAHQAALRFIGGRDVFERIGVPGVQQQPIFDRGGIMPAGAPASGPTITLYVGVGVTQKDAQQIVAYGLDGRTGEDIVVNKIQSARIRGRRV